MASCTQFSWNCIWTTKQKANLKWLWRHMVETKNLTTKLKNRERANNSLSYRFAAINKSMCICVHFGLDTSSICLGPQPGKVEPAPVDLHRLSYTWFFWVYLVGSILRWVFFVQSTLADRYNHLRELSVLSLKCPCIVE